MEEHGRTDRVGEEPYPTMARALLMDGDEGGVAVASRLRPELEGGDVEGTVRLTTGASSPSPVKGTHTVGHWWQEVCFPFRGP